MAVYPLNPMAKGSHTLYPQNSLITEDAAKAQYTWYLTDHFTRDDHGEVSVNYRLHSNKPQSFRDYMEKDILCPKCGQRMHPVAPALDSYDLPLYSCPNCEKER